MRILTYSIRYRDVYIVERDYASRVCVCVSVYDNRALERRDDYIFTTRLLRASFACVTGASVESRRRLLCVKSGSKLYIYGKFSYKTRYIYRQLTLLYYAWRSTYIVI